MPTLKRNQVKVPADVMPESRDEYIENYLKATQGTGRLMLFACDQKMEHLNGDFYGEGIDPSDNDPEHLFQIGAQGVCGVLAGQRGLIVVLWIYPRGKAVADEKDPALIAGAAGAALCLGADFVKVNPPKATEGKTSAENLAIASQAAGRTGLVCAGGSKASAEDFLSNLYDQIHVGGAVGNATGRNIHMRSLDEAVRLTKAISAITLADYEVADALAVFNGEKDFTI